MTRRASFLLASLTAWLSLLLLIAVPIDQTRAQDLSTPLDFDEDATGEVSLVTLEPVFVLANTEAQSVQIVVSAITPGFTPAFRVEDPDGATIADVPNPGGRDRLERVLLLASAGDYRFLVKSANGFGGQFAIRVGAASPPVLLAPGAALDRSLNAESPLDRFIFESASAALALQIESDGRAEQADAAISLIAPDGTELARSRLTLSPLLFTIAPNSGSYLLSVQASQDVRYRLSLQPADGSVVPVVSPTLPVTAPPAEVRGAIPTVPPPELPEQVASSTLAPTPLPTAVSGPTPLPAPAALASSCTVTPLSAGRINVRNGPGLNFPVVTQIARGENALVTGRNADGSWDQIMIANLTAWVSSPAMRHEGDCETVPVFGVAGSASGPIADGDAPDLIVVSASASPASPVEDTTFLVNATIANVGTAPSTGAVAVVNLSPEAPVELTAEFAVVGIPPLDAGASITLTFAAFGTDDSGTINASVTADSDGAVAEIAEDNNAFPFVITVQETLADLTVLAVVADPDTGTTDVDITVTMRNLGGVEAENFQVALLIQPSDLPPQMMFFEGVGPGETESRSVEINVAEPGSYIVTANADAGNVVPELNEDNNQGLTGFRIGG